MGEMVIEAQRNVLRVAETAQSRVLEALLEAKVPLVSLNPLHRTLEEVYVDTTRQSDREAGKRVKELQVSRQGERDE